MKNEKQTVFRFPFFYENEKRMKVLKIQRKNLLNMKMVVNYLNFVFLIEVKAKSKSTILNFVFQFIKNTKWHFGYTDCSLFFMVHKFDCYKKFVNSLNDCGRLVHLPLLLQYYYNLGQNIVDKSTKLSDIGFL